MLTTLQSRRPRIRKSLYILNTLRENKPFRAFGPFFTAINAKQNTLPATGSSTQPIYVSAAGTVTACSLGAAATKGVSTSVTSGDSNLVTGDAVFQAINKANASVVITFTGGGLQGASLNHQCVGTITTDTTGSTSTSYSWDGSGTSEITLPYGNNCFTIALMNQYPEFTTDLKSSATTSKTYSVYYTNRGINISGSGSGTLTIYGYFRLGDSLEINSTRVHSSSSTKPYIKLHIVNGQLSRVSHNLRVPQSYNASTSKRLYLTLIDSMVWE